MENETFDIASLIHNGGVIDGVEGNSPEEIYANICNAIKLPEGMEAKQIYDALCAREKILSTAVGNGIALPHARAPIIKNEEDQKIVVAYLKEPVDMDAPDDRKVKVMFVLLTQNPQTHLKVLSSLVALLRKQSFKQLLDNHASEAQLINSIKELV